MSGIGNHAYAVKIFPDGSFSVKLSVEFEDLPETAKTRFWLWTFARVPNFENAWIIKRDGESSVFRIEKGNDSVRLDFGVPGKNSPASSKSVVVATATGAPTPDDAKNPFLLTAKSNPVKIPAGFSCPKPLFGNHSELLSVRKDAVWAMFCRCDASWILSTSEIGFDVRGLSKPSVRVVKLENGFWFAVSETDMLNVVTGKVLRVRFFDSKGRRLALGDVDEFSLVERRRLSDGAMSVVASIDERVASIAFQNAQYGHPLSRDFWTEEEKLEAKRLYRVVDSGFFESLSLAKRPFD